MFTIDISKVPHGNIIALIIFILSAVLGPYWYIFQFANKTFHSLNIIPLLLLCLSIGGPVIILNLFFKGITGNVSRDNLFSINTITVSAVVSLVIYYFPGISLLIDDDKSLREAIRFSVIIQFSLFMTDIFMGWEKRKKARIAIANTLAPKQKQPSEPPTK